MGVKITIALLIFMSLSTFIFYVHFLCLPKEIEPKEKALFR